MFDSNNNRSTFSARNRCKDLEKCPICGQRVEPGVLRSHMELRHADRGAYTSKDRHTSMGTGCSSFTLQKAKKAEEHPTFSKKSAAPQSATEPAAAVGVNLHSTPRVSDVVSQSRTNQPEKRTGVPFSLPPTRKKPTFVPTDSSVHGYVRELMQKTVN